MIVGLKLKWRGPFKNFVKFDILRTLEIPASRVFLGANPQLLGTSLAGAKMPLVYVLSHYLN